MNVSFSPQGLLWPLFRVEGFIWAEVGGKPRFAFQWTVTLVAVATVAVLGMVLGTPK